MAKEKLDRVQKREREELSEVKKKKKYTNEENAKGLARFSLQMTTEDTPGKNFQHEGWLNTGIDCMRSV